MNNVERLLAFLKSSFLGPLIEDDFITDISYNGQYLHYVHNLYGRKRYDPIIEQEEVVSFLRQIANLSEQHFSYSQPILDVSIGHYRLNAIGLAIARLDYQKTVTFSLRIGKAKQDHKVIKFQPEPALDHLFRALVKGGISIVIAGKTGSGKTEFQKYLISIMNTFARIIVIDNVLELEAIVSENPLDVNIWQVNSQLHKADFSSLIENALRSHPDWIIVAEARGGEMQEALMAAMTGHPIITTVHSLDIATLPMRMARMVISKQTTLRYAETLADIKDHFPILVYLRKRENEQGHIIREIEAIGEMRSSAHKIKLIYQWDGTHAKFSKISPKLMKKLPLNSLENTPFVNKDS